MKKIFILLVAIPIFVACSSDDDANSNTVSVTLKFSQNWEGVPVAPSDLSSTVYTNELGNQLNISSLRYLISKMELKNSEGEIITVGGFQLVDLSNPDTFTFESLAAIAPGNYTFSFVYGFNEQDNQSGVYPELNQVSWNWPEMLGGGYHFLQLDGNYNVNSDPSPFNFHNGTARVGEDDFEQNFVVFNFSNTLNINSNTNTIEIKMDISEWFKNPHTWDLNEYNTDLMMNYTAQKMMQDNAYSVFSIQTVSTP